MDKYLTCFLIGFSMMFTAHYMLEPTYGVGEKRSNSVRAIMNYAVGTVGIGVSFLYLHPELWLDISVSVLGAGSATVLAHSRDFIATLLRKVRAHGLIEAAKDKP